MREAAAATRRLKCPDFLQHYVAADTNGSFQAQRTEPQLSRHAVAWLFPFGGPAPLGRTLSSLVDLLIEQVR
jgi:hypothetical protein